jgi:alkyldihydroxyacetonephosphate synthase
MDIGAAIASEIPGLSTSHAEVDRLAYARDLWPRHHIDVRAGKMLEGSRPALIAWPRSTDEVARLVRLCAAEGTPVVPFGAGSGVCAGVLPDARMVVLDLKRMSRWRSLDEGAPSLSVEAGAMGITLEDDLGRKGYTAGHFPSSILCSTVGGWLAARGAGQCSGRYGKIEDMVVDLEMVDGRGEIVTLSRRAAGPDLTPLLIGSEGTLGVITAATLRLHPTAAARAYAAYEFPTVEAGWGAMRALFQAGLRPPVARLYDPFDSFMARMGGKKTSTTPGGGRAGMLKVLRAPRALNGVMDALSGNLLGGAMLVLIFEGEGHDPDDDARAAAKIAARLGGKPLGEGPARHWLAHRYSVSYRQAPIFRGGAFSDTMEVAAPWSRLGALYDGVRRALGKHVFVMAHLSHAYPDGCSIYFTFAGSAESNDAAAARYDQAWREALPAAIEAGGTLSHHHGVGRSKAPRMGSELGLGVEVVRGLMRALDPAGIMNPGNLIPAANTSPPAPPANPPATRDGFNVDLDSRLATLPGAMALDEARRLLAERGASLPLSEAAPWGTGKTVSAWLAEGAAGAPDPWLDPVDHLVAGVRARLPSGASLSVSPSPRRAVGPDLVSLFVGTRERFGSVTAIDVRVLMDGDTPARPLPFGGPRNPAVSGGEERLLAAIEARVREVR